MQNFNSYGQPYLNGGNQQASVDEDELYGGFNNLASTQQIAETVAPSFSPGSGMTAGTQAPGTVRPGTAGAFGPRPMTSNVGAGYKRAPAKNPLGAFVQSITENEAPALEEKLDESPEFVAMKMEREVNQLVEESCAASAAGDKIQAIEKAKEAAKKERALTKYRDKFRTAQDENPNNIDLTYSVYFNLASQLEANNLLNEALSTYSIIVKNRQYAFGARLRVNMGNIFFKQKQYPNAIKMYRMAMDQIGQISKETKFKIMRNIANSFVRLGQFQDAIHSYEQITESFMDTQSGYNLIVCYFALGDKEKMKRGFLQLLSAFLSGVEKQCQQEMSQDDSNKTALKSKDELRDYLRVRRKKELRFVHNAAKLIAPVIEKDFIAGYDWVIYHLKAPTSSAHGDDTRPGFPRIAMEMEIAKGIAYLKRKMIPEAIEVFKGFERQEASTGLIDQAATNLSFLYFLEGEYKAAEKYADMAVRADRYNAKALVNKANVFFVLDQWEQAKELYLESIGVEADCVEAIYNLGLVNRKLGNLEDALQAFRKLHRIVPKDPQVIYQIANIFDEVGDTTNALKWFKILQGIVPSDPKILFRMGTLYSKIDEDNTAFHHYLDCYNVFPVNVEVVSWLGIWYVNSSMFEKAIEFFERCAEVEPQEMKWKLMVAACYRRMRSYTQALAIYKDVYKQDPDNIECLQYISNILKQFNDPDYEKFARLYRKAQRQEMAKESKYVQGPEQEEDDDEAMPMETQNRQGPGGAAYRGSYISTAEAPEAEQGDEQRLDARFFEEVSEKPVQKLQPRAADEEEDDDWGGEEVLDLLE